MRVCCIVPARKGSKRLPNKNRMKLMGKPLLDYTFDVAFKCNFISEYFLITDDIELQNYYSKIDGVIIINEPKELAQDEVPAWKLVKYVMNRWFNMEMFSDMLIIFLQATSPLRIYEDILGAWNLYNQMNQSIASVTYEHKWKFILNGSIYITPYSDVIKFKSLWKQAKHLYVMPKERSIDIDTIEDWDEAERILNGKPV